MLQTAGSVCSVAESSVAVNCMVAATAIEGFAGVTAIDINWFAEEPAMPEHATWKQLLRSDKKEKNRNCIGSDVP